MRTVTVSASYGAGGSVIGPALAGVLNLPFLDRAVHAADAEQAAVSLGEAALEEERTQGVIGRIMTSFARMPDAFGPGAPPTGLVEPDEAARRQAEARVQAFIAEHEGGVVLGWAGTLIVPHAYHVRLDGPPERRVEQAAVLEDLDREAAAHRRQETDRIRSLYMRRLYGRDWADPRLYHLVVDSTAISFQDCAQLIAAAARAFWAKRA
ncbi:MAG TPA: cytidylate kinase-like family protein [Acidimicrobiales bacterium]|nr:cytidylate kinase-like family protein [Acidimicrobiales bacterium]